MIGQNVGHHYMPTNTNNTIRHEPSYKQLQILLENFKNVLINFFF